MSWQLLVGGVDVSGFLLDGAQFSEQASSSNGQALFSLNGNVLEAVIGASVVLNDSNGNPLWEGTVATSTPQSNRQGQIIATLATATPLASQTQVNTSTTSSNNNDISAIAQNLVSQTPLPWGSSPDLGQVVGGLNFSRVDNALSTLAILANAQWRVQNGAVVFIGNAGDQVQIPTALVGQNQPHSQVNVLGGIDQTSRIALAISTATLSVSGGTNVTIGNANHPEIGDRYTLGLLANNYAEIYGTNFTGSATFSGVTVRAGDGIVDTNGQTGIAQSVTHQLTQGNIQSTVQTGAPPLASTPIYAQSFSDTMHRLPPARVRHDYVISGGGVTYAGLTATVAAINFALSDVLYSWPQQNVTLPATGTAFITAAVSGFTIQGTLPLPGSGIALSQFTTLNGTLVGYSDVRSHGGIATNNIQSNAVTWKGIKGDTSGDTGTSLVDSANLRFLHGGMSTPTQSAIQPTVGSDNSYAASNIVSNRTIQGVSLASTQVLPAFYSTQQPNVAYSTGLLWSTAASGGSSIAANTLLTASEYIYYNTGSVVYSGTSTPAQTTYKAPTYSGSGPNPIVYAQFQHQIFASGSPGNIRVFFTGTNSTSGSTGASTGFNNTSTGSVYYYRAGNSGPNDPYYYNYNGATISQSVATGIAIGAGNPITMVISSISCPSNVEGSSSLTITLTNSGGTVLQTWAGITTTQTLSYSTSQSAGTYTWNVTAVTAGTGINPGQQVANFQYACSWSSSLTYWSVTPATCSYVLAADGVTQRINTLDNNITFLRIAPDTIVVPIYNNNTTAGGNPFAIGIDVTGL